MHPHRHGIPTISFRLHTALCLLGGFLLSRPLAAQTSDIRILSSDAGGAVIEYRPVYTKADTILIDGARYIALHAGSTSADGSLRPGDPGILYRRATLRFPGTGGNRIDILAAEFDELPSVRPAPLPSLRKIGGEWKTVYRIDRKSYGRPGLVPATPVRLGPIGESRGVMLGSVLFAPVQYDPSSGSVRKYSRILARISFGPAMRTAYRPDRLSRPVPLNGAASVQAGAGPARTFAQTNSVLAGGPWFRFPVTDEGMYKLTGQALLAAGIPASTDPGTIRIFGNGGLEVPMNLTDPYPDDLIENAVYLHDGGTTGRLDPADYIIFFGKGTRGWNYSAGDKSFHHYLNHYTETNYYWLTYGGAQHLAMAPLQRGTSASPYQTADLDCRIFYEDEKVNILASGLEWLGPAMNPGDQRVFTTPLPGLDPSHPIRYRLHVGAHAAQDSYMGIFEHAAPLGPSVYMSGTEIDYDFSPQLIDGYVDQTMVPGFSDNQSQLRLSYVTNDPGGSGYLDWFELFYGRRPAAQNDLAVFSAPDTSAVVRYAVSGFTAGQVYVFDVTSYNGVTVDDAPPRSGDTCIVQITAQAGTARQLYVAGTGGFKTPGALTQVGNQNLHGDTTQADCIIVTHADFLQAANRLKNYREQNAAHPLRVKVVDVSQIYNEFGGGLLSPAAIRNYLRYLSGAWSSPPAYLLLFGTGSYDYRGILGAPMDGIPPWETEESSTPIYSYATDDEFAILQPGDHVNMGVGRLTPRSLTEANTMVDKIIEYETHSVEDPWRIRATFVADDAWSGYDEPLDGTTHMDHAEAVAAMLPPMFEQRKIYEFSYPTVIEAGDRRKPTCNVAIDNQINEGTLILNYSGHGNPDLWAHEHVFVRETDFPLLTNKGKYFFLVAATCNYSAYDELGTQSGGELLVGMPNAGACAVFSAIRPVVAIYNLPLNEELFAELFRTDSSGRVLPERLGDVVYRTKQNYTDYTNDQKFFLLGDPMLNIGFPGLFAKVDSINGVPGDQQTQLRALARTSVAVTVRDFALHVNAGYSGTAQLVVYDAEQTVNLVDPDAGPVSYKTTGSVLFHGVESVNSGALSARFIVPKDISYGNDRGRITVYTTNPTTDGAGYATNFTVGGTDSSGRTDTKGPDIRLYLDNRGFRPGDVVGGSPVLIADLSDSSGLNTSASGVGHRMELWLDDNPQSRDVSDFYQTKPNTYQEGTITYPLGALDEGTHKLRLRVWDTYDNPSSLETVFEVLSGSGLQLSNVYNFPNPFRSATAFTFEHNQVTPVDAVVKIYTVAGRLIQTLQVANVSTQFVQIPWDGRDRDGDRIANGIYLYKILASTHDHRLSGEAVGKLSVAR